MSYRKRKAKSGHLVSGFLQQKRSFRASQFLQFVPIAVFVFLYFLIRGLTNSNFSHAAKDARSVIELEKDLHLFHEPALQHFLIRSSNSIASHIFNSIYIYGHWPVLIGTLIWLGFKHPSTYKRVRNAILLSGSIGLVIFATFPVAPPRLMNIGLIDTVSKASPAYRFLQPSIFTNQYAAMPSLHIGWNLLIVFGIFLATRKYKKSLSILLRTSYVILAAAMAVSVVITANHYIIDAIAGMALTTASWFAVGKWHRADK